MSTIILENSFIEYDLTECLLQFIFYKNRFNDLQYFKENDKIMIWDNKIYIDNYEWYYQPFIRFITGQSRITIQTYMGNEFNAYITNILNIITKIKAYLPKTHDKYSLLNDLLNRNIALITKILPGLKLLRKSYEENPPDINISLNPIIYKLTQFLNKHNNQKKKEL